MRCAGLVGLVFGHSFVEAADKTKHWPKWLEEAVKNRADISCYTAMMETTERVVAIYCDRCGEHKPINRTED